tara:strand:- start:185 stop:358 length:174 start_codon:yes stop_codon:yes gene_type:complete
MMDTTKEIERLKLEQQEIAGKILGSNPGWCYLQGQLEALTKVVEDAQPKKDPKKESN